MTLCDVRLDATLVVRAPMHVGGESRVAYVQRRRGKSRGVGERFRTTQPERGDRGQLSEVTLPIRAVPSVGGKVDAPIYVPGTSLRGVIRHGLWRRLDRAMEQMGIGALWDRDRPSDARDTSGTEDDDPNTRTYWETRFGNVLVRHLFGSESRRGAVEVSHASGHAGGRVAYSDALLEGDNIPATRMLTRNRLDRFTMQSTTGLRNFACVEAGTELSTSLRLTSFGWWQVAAIGLALRGFDARAWTLGRGGGTGLGRVEIRPTALTVRWHHAVAPDAERPLPAIGACLTGDLMNRVTGGDGGLRRRIEGQFRVDGHEGRMFVLDPDDTLDAPAPSRTDRDRFTVSWTWQGDRVETMLRRTGTRLVAAARTLCGAEVS